MIKRWRQEIAKHEFPKYPYLSEAPVPPDGEEKCHCYLGPGFMRKRRPYGCTVPRCGICHYEKHLPKNRANEKRAAILFEIEAEGV
jgi:hypothetical protein